MLRSSMNLGDAGKAIRALARIVSGAKALHVKRQIPLHRGDQFYRQGQSFEFALRELFNRIVESQPLPHGRGSVTCCKHAALASV
jgi:hypothetical protein